MTGDQMDLLTWEPPRYPDGPGFAKGSDTSEAAAKATAKRALTNQGRILAWLRAGNTGTGDEIAAALDLHIIQVRPRLAEMRKNGLVADTGARRATAMDCQAIIWCAAGPMGRADG